MRILVHWLIITVALAVTAWLLPGVHMASVGTLLLSGAILGLVNALVRPVLSLIALPLTVLTLGLFYLVVNGAAFALAASLVRGFEVSSWLSAILGALLVSVLSTILGSVLAEDPQRNPRSPA
jgi:putative membrane protein